VRADALGMTSISSVGGVNGFQPPPPPPNDTIKKAYDAAAQKLGMSDDDLRSALQSGSSLADVAASKGVSTDDLVSAVAGSLQGAQLPDGASATDLATNLVNRKGGGGGHGHHHHHASSSTDSTGYTPGDNVQALADTLGVDKDTLMQQFRSGDLNDLLSSVKGQYTQASAIAGAGGLQVDEYA
jgi:uncharacterized protein YidB (DUF937 family)